MHEENLTLPECLGVCLAPPESPRIGPSRPPTTPPYKRWLDLTAASGHLAAPALTHMCEWVWEGLIELFVHRSLQLLTRFASFVLVSTMPLAKRAERIVHLSLSQAGTRQTIQMRGEKQQDEEV